MRKLCRRVGKLLLGNAFEIAALAGLACLLRGCALVWEPLPWLIGGGLALAGGVWGALPRRAE